MRKVYGMPGVAQAQVVLTSASGKTKYKIPFTDGITTSRDKTPAKFTTDNPIIQDVIESDPIFNKKIFLLNTYDRPATVEPTSAPAKVAAPKGRPAPKKTKPAETETKKQVYEEVTNLGEAITILMQVGTVPAENMTSVEGVLKAASELGVSFPNLVND